MAMTLTPSAAPPIFVQSAARSDVGRRRTNNEDAFLAEPALGLFAVADGMGGHNAGEVASQLAVTGLRRAMESVPDGPFLADPSLSNRRRLLEWLAGVVDDINAAIHRGGQEDIARRGMGCTIDVALVRGSHLFLAHVGDGRAYLRRGDALRPLTEDHTLGQLLLASGTATPDEVAANPQRNVLMRALGPYPKVQVDTAYFELAPGDTFLLCSDGLYNEVPEGELAARLARPPAEAAAALIEAALDAGARDNVTAVVFRADPPAACRAVIGDGACAAVLGGCTLFGAFTPSELLRVQQIAVARTAAAGDELYRENEPCESLFVLLDGHVTVTREGQRVGEIGPGDPFGDLTLAGVVSVATAVADVACRALEFPLADLHRLLAADHALAAKLTAAALARVGKRLHTMVNVVARYRRILGDLSPLP